MRIGRNLIVGFYFRKLDSPLDSGIDSPRCLQGSSHSTNTSVCSSPRSSVEDEKLNAKDIEEDQRKQMSASDNSSYEDRHPLLKRALQQPPQIYNNNLQSSSNCGTVSHFQDEVYKPHKKFRRNTSGSMDDSPTSTQAGPNSPPPPPPSQSSKNTCSLLASQLAEPPKYLAVDQKQQIANREERPTNKKSLLASTLSEVTTSITSEECRRNEILAKFILEGNPSERFSGLPRCALNGPTSSSQLNGQPAPAHSGGSTDSALRLQLQSGQPPQGLLMCANSTSGSWWKNSAGSIPSQPGTASGRHLPVPPAPTRTSLLTLSPLKESTSKASVMVANTQGDSQPLNLSIKTPPPANTQQSHHDISTEA